MRLSKEDELIHEASGQPGLTYQALRLSGVAAGGRGDPPSKTPTGALTGKTPATAANTGVGVVANAALVAVAAKSHYFLIFKK